MIIDALVLQTKLFLQDDMDINILSCSINEEKVTDKLMLKDYTAMIGTGGKLSLILIMSFDTSSLQNLVELFLEGEEPDESEIEEIRDSVAGETINTIIGLALPTFPNRGKNVTITPPISINDASNVLKHKDSKIVTAEIETSVGIISISAVGSEEYLK